MNTQILLHEGFIELILLFIILASYYSKAIPQNYMAICLLGTYILSKSVLTFGHWWFHKLTDKKPNCMCNDNCECKKSI